MLSNRRTLKKIAHMSPVEFLEFMTGGRVTVRKVGQVVGNKIIPHYVARIRGVVVASGDKWLHATLEEARQFGHQVMARWREELAMMTEDEP